MSSRKDTAARMMQPPGLHFQPGRRLQRPPERHECAVVGCDTPADSVPSDVDTYRSFVVALWLCDEHRGVFEEDDHDAA